MYSNCRHINTSARTYMYIFTYIYIYIHIHRFLYFMPKKKNSMFLYTTAVSSTNSMAFASMSRQNTALCEGVMEGVGWV